jgi:hypothetical protein
MRVRQKLILFCGILAAGAIIGGLSALLGLSGAATNAIAGASLALLAVYGIPYAFGLPGPALHAKRGKTVEPSEPAIGAKHRHRYIATTDVGDSPVIDDALEQDILSTYDPAIVPTGGAAFPGALGFENRPEFVGVGHNGSDGSVSTDE